MPSHHSVEALSIEGGIHYRSTRLDFTGALNCVIGGPGTGKTGLLRLVRFALGARVPPAYAEEIDSHIRDTLGPGRVTLSLRTQHGIAYTVSRAYGEPPRICNAGGEVVSGPLDEELFTIEAYEPKEFEHIAVTPSAQIELLDRLAASEIRALGNALDDVERLLAQNAVERGTIEAAIARDEAREAELPAVADALKGFALEGGGDPEATARAQVRKVARGRERRAMGELAKEVGHVRAALEAWAKDALRRIAGAVEAEHEKGACAPPFERANAAAHRLAGGVEAGVAVLRAELAKAEAALAVEAGALATLHHAEDLQYEALVVQADADRARAAERERLHRRFEELSAIAKKVRDVRAARDAKLAERRALLDRRAALLKERHSIRLRVGRDLAERTGGTVLIDVRRGGDTAAYFALLKEILEGTGVREDVLAWVADGIPPEELVAAVESDDGAAIEAVDKMKTGKPARAQKLLAALRASGRLAEVETVRVGDIPLIELRTEKGYRPFARLSTGQKCICALSMILVHAASPLLVDQIEDQLDNQYVYEVLVKTLEKVKAGRQLIVVTHNANVPVLGDAERVFVLDADENGGHLVAFGDVDEQCEPIERILDGGPEAFLRRSERYGHTPPRGEGKA